MSVLNDLVREIEDYPRDHLELDIVEVHWPGPEINVGDDCTFRIRAKNTGPLDMLQLRLKVEGLAHTLVKSNALNSDWGEDFTISGAYFGDVPAHQGDGEEVVSRDDPFMFRPQWESSTARDLVRVSVEGWDTSLDHVMKSHSKKDEAAYGTYPSTVESN